MNMLTQTSSDITMVQNQIFYYIHVEEGSSSEDFSQFHQHTLPLGHTKRGQQLYINEMHFTQSSIQENLLSAPSELRFCDMKSFHSSTTSLLDLMYSSRITFSREAAARKNKHDF